MRDYHYICSNSRCNYPVMNAARDLILLCFQCKDSQRSYLFHRCPLCQDVDYTFVGWFDAQSWKRHGTLHFQYTYDDSSQEFITKLKFFPDELTPLHCDLAAVLMFDDQALQRELNLYVYPKGTAENP